MGTYPRKIYPVKRYEIILLTKQNGIGSKTSTAKLRRMYRRCAERNKRIKEKSGEAWATRIVKRMMDRETNKWAR